MKSSSGNSSAAPSIIMASFSIAYIDEIEIGIVPLGMSGIDHEIAVHAANAHGADRTGERNVGDAERGRSPVDGEHVGVVLAVGAQQKPDDLGIEEVALWGKAGARDDRSSAR